MKLDAADLDRRRFARRDHCTFPEHTILLTTQHELALQREQRKLAVVRDAQLVYDQARRHLLHDDVPARYSPRKSDVARRRDRAGRNDRNEQHTIFANDAAHLEAVAQRSVGWRLGDLVDDGHSWRLAGLVRAARSEGNRAKGETYAHSDLQHRPTAGATGLFQSDRRTI